MLLLADCWSEPGPEKTSWQRAKKRNSGGSNQCGDSGRYCNELTNHSSVLRHAQPIRVQDSYVVAIIVISDSGNVQ